MDEQNTAKDAPVESAPVEAVASAPAAGPRDNRGPRGRRGPQGGGNGRDRGGNRRTGGKREERQRSEFDQKTLLIRRVARVTAGGRRFSFSAAIVIGDRKGRVGVGVGKGGDTAGSIEKALRDAKKNMIIVKTTKTMSIGHDVMAKESSGIVEIRPAKERGIVAGSAVKMVLELAGVKDVTAKIHSPSKNKLNIARATIKALSKLK